MTDQPPLREPVGPPDPAYGQPPYPPYPPYPPPPYGPPPYGPPPYGPYPPYAYPRPINTYAILALVLGAAVFPPLGIYFGKKAKQQIAQTGERGVELATAGLVVGSILTAIYGLVILVYCVVVGIMITSSGFNG